MLLVCFDSVFLYTFVWRSTLSKKQKTKKKLVNKIYFIYKFNFAVIKYMLVCFLRSLLVGVCVCVCVLKPSQSK